MKIIMISNLFFQKNAANCIQSRSMFKAFKKNFDVDFLFKDNSTYIYRYFRIFISCFSQEIIFTRSYSVALICRFIQAKCIYELHELHSNRNYRLLAGNSSLSILCISNSLKNEFMKRISMSNVNIFVRHDGCDIEKIKKIKKSSIDTPIYNLKEIGKGKKIILHTGSTYKFDECRFSEILKKLPKNWIFIQLGNVEESISMKFLKNENIVFLPNCPHTESLNAQQQADCLLYLNFPESRLFNYTSPLKLFEYIISGKPLISTVGGATDEILLTLDEYGSYDDMTNYLDLISSGCKDNQFSNQAKRLADEHSWEERANFIIKTYLEPDIDSIKMK